jgi:hypothetical protein
MLNIGVILQYVVLLQKFTPLSQTPSCLPCPLSSTWLYYVTMWATGISSGLLIRCRLVVLLRFVCSCDSCAALCCLVVGLFGAAGSPLVIFSASINLEKNVNRGTVTFCRVAAFAMALWSRRAGGPHAGRQRAGVVQRRGMGPPLHLRHHQGAVWAGGR